MVLLLLGGAIITANNRTNMADQKEGSKGFISKMLYVIEKVGNALPHPATLFAIFAFLIIIISWLTSLSDMSVVHPSTGKVINPKNLMSLEGLHYMITSLVGNFTSFAPLGVVLVAMLGIGIAEGTGLIGTDRKSVV